MKSLVYPIGSEVPIVEPLPATVLLTQHHILYPYHNNVGFDNDDLLVNKDGSLPVNSPLNYFYNIIQEADKNLKHFSKADGFYRNLIFAENLFQKENDGMAMNNAVVNVNIFMKENSKENLMDKLSKRRLSNSNSGSGGVEIVISNDYENKKETVNTLK